MILSPSKSKTKISPKAGGSSFPRWLKPLFYLIAVIAHVVIIVSISFTVPEQENRKDNTIFKVVDISEFVPEEKPEEKKKEELPPPPPPKEEQIEVDPQEGIVEDVQITEKVVVEQEKPIEFLPQHKISDPPGIPTDIIRSQIVYPTLANRQKVEGVVYLELYIDTKGNIRRIEVLKDPGYGLAEAALKAFEGITCTPAMANGQAVAVRFRYPIRFQLK